MAIIPMIPVGRATTLNRSILLTERRMSGTGGDDFRFGLPPQVPATYLRASAQWRGRLCGAALVRAFLNRTHQARIAHHIRGEDRGETPGGGRGSHCSGAGCADREPR